MSGKSILGSNVLIFCSSKNSHGKQDATGAFIPEAKAFAKHYGVPDQNVYMIDCTKTNKPANRRSVVLKALWARGEKSIKAIAFFGHGWPSGIQFGYKKVHIPVLAQAIAGCSTNDVKVGIFACLTAENDVRDTKHKQVGPGTDGGFADLLRDELVRQDIVFGWVDAHKTAGHTTWNPYVVRFLCEDVTDREYGAEGGGWIVEPGSRYWKRWCNVLRNNEGGMRYDFFTEKELGIHMRIDRSWVEDWQETLH